MKRSVCFQDLIYRVYISVSCRMLPDLSSLPFGTLAKAAKLVQSESGASDSDEDTESNDNESSRAQEDPSKLASSSKTPTDRHKKVKRIDKHA